MPAFARAILIQESAEGGLSYKETKKAENPCIYKVFRLIGAGDERIELPLKVLETSVIPFDQSPVCCSPNIYTMIPIFCQYLFEII